MATITKRRWTTGKGEDREAWTLAYTDRQGKRHKEQFAKKREAETRRVEVEGQISKGAFRAEAAKKTVKDAIDAYIKHLERRHEKGEQVTTMYLRNTTGQLRGHIQPELGDKKLSELTARGVTDLIDKLKDNGIGLPTIRRAVGTLSRALQFAVGQDMVAGNPVKGIRVTGRRGEGSEKVVPPTKKELADIQKAAKEQPERRSKQPTGLLLRIQFAAAAGLRASEQWALLWRHIDLDTAVVTIETRVDGFGNFDTTKSLAGTRTIPLGKTIVAALKEWREETRYGKDEDFVFPDARGGFTRHTNFMKREWKPLIKSAKVKDIGWHALRHFAISTWIEAGLQPKAVQTLAGHSTFQITMSRYGHLFPSDDHSTAMDKIAAALYAK
ncbi:tyrosine-type recombinase/integrase [Sinorhizobium medicae]|nr:tyrosine-type recombinase/integrase [Sinorhizobium medicae]MDX1152391.1 tyrosine-type recombinase/integrase [Sinorhizobium medicae]